MKLFRRRLLLLTLLTVFAELNTNAQGVTPEIDKVADTTVWRIQNRKAHVIVYGKRKAVQLDAQPDTGMAWMVGSDFSTGTIELDLRGKNIPGQSFVGVAFHEKDSLTYDAVYFRPFNFRSSEPGHRAHSVQYISQPEFPWERLRSEYPGKYEQPIIPAPDPDAWLHARIVIQEGSVTVFVNSSSIPSLVVRTLKEHQSGPIGLWVGNNSAGEFSSITITNKTK